jgi:protein-S-isoprenylcysteine O-methyltransferase Ste14
MVRRVIQLAIMLLIFAASLFLTSGRLDWVMAWAYLAWCISAPAIPLMLGSLWGLILALLGVCALVIRTGLEDRTLREELPGYQDYARRVRYRLLPGLW